jgi:hypothetical protein
MVYLWIRTDTGKTVYFFPYLLGRCELFLGADEDQMHVFISCSHGERYWTKARKIFDLKLPWMHRELGQRILFVTKCSRTNNGVQS